MAETQKALNLPTQAAPERLLATPNHAAGAMSDAHAQARARRATSTVVPGIIGCGYDSPYATWLQVMGRDKPPEHKPEFERGSFLQGAIEAWAAHKLGYGYEAAEYVAHQNGWTGDSTDILFHKPDTGEVVALGEIKTVGEGARDKWGVPGTQQVPKYVRVQCAWHLIHHPDVEICYVPVLFGGYRFVFDMYHVRRDIEFEKRLFEEVTQWWVKHVENDQAPQMSKKDTEWVSDKYTHAEKDRQAEITEELVEAVALRCKYEPIVKKAGALVEAANNRIRNLMGSAHLAQHENFKVSWTEIAGKPGTDWKAAYEQLARECKLIEAAKENIVTQHTTTRGGYRRLTVTPRGAFKDMQ